MSDWVLAEEESPSSGDWVLAEEESPSYGYNQPAAQQSPKPTIDLNQALKTFGEIESNGNYGAMGMPVNGQRAIGKYQIMPQNIPQWSKAAIGREVTPEEFAKSPELQDQIASYQIQKLISQGKSLEDIASIWNSGRDYKGNTRTDKATGLSVDDYVKKFVKHYNGETGIKGVGKDIYNTLSNAPSLIYESLSNLPSQIYQGGKQIVTNPERAGENILSGFAGTGRGIANTPAYIADYLADKELISPDNSVSKFRAPEYSIPESLGVEGEQEGDAALQGLGSYAPFGALGELGAFGKLGRFGARGGANSAYGVTQNQNPLESAILGAGIDVAGRGIGAAKDLSKNSIINKLKKDASSKKSLSPEQANENLLRNYLSKEGKPMDVDIGTLTQNPFLSKLYQITSSVPFSKGSKQKNTLREQLLSKYETLAKSENEKSLNEANALMQESQAPLDRQDYGAEEIKGQRDNTLEELNKSVKEHNSLSDYTGMANQSLNELQTNVSPKNHLSEIFNAKKQESKELYKPVTDSDIDLSKISEKKDFKRYNNAYKETKPLSDNLTSLFGNDLDLGRKVSSEIGKAKNFVEAPHESIDLKSALQHIKNLQNYAAQAKESGSRAEASHLNKMASGLKGDIKDILYENGYGEVAQALEDADKHYINEILPFYGSREIKKTVTNKKYIPEPSKLAKALHDQNYFGLLKSLPEDARKSLAFESITGGKYSSEGLSSLSPSEISSRYQSLPTNTRKAINDLSPEIDNYFENLGMNLDKQKNIEKKSKSLEKKYLSHENKISKLNEKSLKDYDKKQKESLVKKQKSEEMIKKSNDSLNQSMSKRYDKPQTGNQGATSSFKGFSPGQAASLAGVLTGGYMAPGVLAASIPFAIPAARGINKFLTSPKLREKYIKGDKFNNQQSSLSNALLSSLTVPNNTNR